MNYKHGFTGTRLYRTWCSMRRRCDTPSVRCYPNYGGRGIKVCADWDNNFESFKAWALSHGYQNNLQIDRINTDGNYEPSNCRFVTSLKNNGNRRDNRALTAFGETRNMAEWSRDLRCTISVAVLCRRIQQGWSHEAAISTPGLKPWALSRQVHSGV